MHFYAMHFRNRHFASQHFVSKYFFSIVSVGGLEISGTYIKILDGKYEYVKNDCNNPDLQLLILDKYHEKLNTLKSITEFIDTSESTYNTPCDNSDINATKNSYYQKLIENLSKLKSTRYINK